MNQYNNKNTHFTVLFNQSVSQSINIYFIVRSKVDQRAATRMNN